jgi:ketosteroid isomerase-like protein
MSQENVEIVRRGFAAFEQGDLGGLLDLLADDLVTYRSDPDGATYHGKEGFLQMAIDWSEGFSEWSFVGERFIEAGDSVVAEVRQFVQSQSSGASVEEEFWFVFEVRGATISKVSAYLRRADALEAVGLLE